MRTKMLSLVLAVLSLVSGEARGNAQDAGGDKVVEVPRAAVVAVMKDAGQALLWDGTRGEYVVVRTGDHFHQFVVTAIDADQVVLSHGGTNQLVVLPRTSDTSVIAGRTAAAGSKTGPKESKTELLDPYPAPATIGLPLLDPYASSGSIPAVVAPPGSRASEPATAGPSPFPVAPPVQPAFPPASPAVPAVQPAPAASPAAVAPAAVAPAVLPAPPVATAPPPAARPGRMVDERYTVSRREFDTAVTDFHQLSKEIQINLTDDGVEVRDLARGSLFYRWGLRAGDVILRIDDHSIRSVDDAALVYARLMAAKKFVVKVKRGPDTVILRYQFTK